MTRKDYIRQQLGVGPLAMSSITTPAHPYTSLAADASKLWRKGKLVIHSRSCSTGNGGAGERIYALPEFGSTLPITESTYAAGNRVFERKVNRPSVPRHQGQKRGRKPKPGSGHIAAPCISRQFVWSRW